MTNQAIINRVLLRKKVLQSVYEQLNNESPSLDKAVKNLKFSIQQTYSLYNYLLLLIVDETEYISQRIDAARHKNLPTEEDLNPNTRFIDNKFAAVLKSNLDLQDYISDHKFSWTENYPEILKDMYEFIQAHDSYKEYMAAESTTFDDDKEIWRTLMKDFVIESESLEAMLEDYSIFWNDDMEVVLSFVLKTIRRMSDKDGAAQKLLPMYREADDEAFGVKLFRNALINKDEYTELIDKNTKGWDIDRVAFMDKTILLIAVAELLNFPTIPVNVTMNEYIELSKSYSSDKSPAFINGVLDNIVKDLTANNKLTKVKIVSNK